MPSCDDAMDHPADVIRCGEMREELPKGSDAAGMVLAELGGAVICWYLFVNGFAWRSRSFWLFIILTILGFFVLFAASVLVLRRIHRPYPAGHCKRCGYDTRMTPKKCPECGKEGDGIYGNI